MAADSFSAWLKTKLDARLAETGVVGASAAVLHKGERATAASGSLNLTTGVVATPDALFQIGSISKTFTTTLVLQLVEEGRLDLDEPVRKHLPTFAVASESVSEQLTLRHLLTHTSGIDGEYFPETGSDSDALENYVRLCQALGQVHAPGDSTSYCNAAFVILGAIVARTAGMSWDACLRDRILAPLALAHATTDYSEFPRFRVAAGHIEDSASKRFAVSKHLHLPRGMGPTGATLHASALDLARYASTFLPHAASDMPRLLRPETIAASLVPQADWPTAKWTGAQMGLGWQLYKWSGRQLFGHDGATFGQTAFLRVLPDEDLVAVLLANGGPSKNLYHALFDDIFTERTGVKLPGTPAIPAGVTFDPHRIVGSYANVLTHADIFVEEGRLMLKTTLAQFKGLLEDQVFPLEPLTANAFVVRNPTLRVQDVVVFHHFAGECAELLSLGHRDLCRLS